MPLATREELSKVLNNKSKEQNKKFKNAVERNIDNVSKHIRCGKLVVPCVSHDPKVREAVAKAFKKEGIKIEFKNSPHTVKASKRFKTPFERQSWSAYISLE